MNPNPLRSFFKGFKFFTIICAWVIGITCILTGISSGFALFVLVGIFSCWCGQSIHRSIQREETNEDHDDESPNFPLGTV